MRRLTAIALAACAAIVLAGCSRVGAVATDDAGAPYPAGCAAHGLSMRRCDLIIDRMAAAHGIDRSTTKAILLLGDPGCGADVPSGQLCVRTTALAARVRFVLPDGTAVEDSRFCGIEAQYDAECTDTPEIRISSPTLSGYLDIPCPGGPGTDANGCASPVPSAAPDAVTAAAALSVPSLDIPVDHLGLFRIPVGEARLPNGLLRTADLTLVDPSPSDLILTDDGLDLEIDPADGGHPLWNLYDQGWRPGVEVVRAVLVFNVRWFEHGAVMRVRNLLVQ